jgi:glucosamine kinase
MQNTTINYILAVDGGGTKTLARLVNIKNQQLWQLEMGPSSLTNDFEGAVQVLSAICKQLLALAQCQAEEVSAVLGLAGTGSQPKVNLLIKRLSLNFAYFRICSDALISAYGANSGQPVAVVALGTGSIGMRLMANGDYSLFGGWGFTLGDEGGGAKLGAAMVKATIDEFEQQAFDVKAKISQLSDCTAQIIGYKRANILGWLAEAKPVDFAKLAPLAFELTSDCPVAAKLITQHTVAVENLISLTLANTTLPLVLMGGLAKLTFDYLTPETKKCLISAKGSALEGAFLLAQQQIRQHLPKENCVS